MSNKLKNNIDVKYKNKINISSSEVEDCRILKFHLFLNLLLENFQAR